MAAAAGSSNEDARREFMEGSIFRVKMSNFLTYTDAEFWPGPRLNVVLGPNGTGKSSIVCALCVGLGGSTKLLGRAEKLTQYVRHKKTYAFTEIELYFSTGNKIIRRIFNRNSNDSRWEINGRLSTKADIVKLTHEADIQIDNLCQFLPQEKVNSFSQMNAQQLLRATEDAYGGADLLKQHETLIEDQKKHKTYLREFDGLKACLNAKINENKQREREVGRLEEHKRRMEETELLKKKIFWAKYDKKQDDLKQVKLDKNKAKAALKLITETQMDPLNNKREEAEELMDAANEEYKNANTTYRTATKASEKCSTKLTEAEDSYSTICDNLKRIHDARQKKERELAQKKETLARYQQQEDDPSNEIPQLIQRKKELEDRIFAIKAVTRSFDTKFQTERNQLTHSETSLTQINNKLKRLQNQKLQRKDRMRRIDADAMEAYDWIHAHKDRFLHPVWGPLALEIEVLDKKNVSMVESGIARDILSSFVVECREDYETLVTEFNDKRKKRLGVYNIQGGKVRQAARAYSEAAMGQLKQKYHIQCYLDEAIKIHKVPLECLRNMNMVHQQLLGNDVTEEIINKDETSTLFEQILGQSSGSGMSLTTPKHKYNTNKSKYSGRAITTNVTQLNQAKILSASSANEEQVNELTKEKEELENTFAIAQAKVLDIKRDRDASFAEEQNLQSSVELIKRAITKGHRRTAKIAMETNRIAELETELLVDETENAARGQTKLKQHIKIYSKTLLQNAEKLNGILVATKVRFSHQINSQMKSCAVEVYQHELRRAERIIKELNDEYKQKRKLVDSVTREMKEALNTAQCNAPLAEYGKAFEALSNDLEELYSRINNNETAMQSFDGDLRVIKEYEEKLAEIEVDQQRVNSMEGSINEIIKNIAKIKDPWYSKLKELIKNINTHFSKFFSEIGCVGEVVLDDSTEDISVWGIERRAQFRANTKLTTMNAQEQSGGEKSVGTIMYMMALQNLTHCPFRVVDEINQGMDARNERKVFLRITKSSCGAKLPQYFMITPKLIPGLDYHEDTKVIVIMNGPYGQPQSSWKIGKFLANASQLHRDGPPSKKQRT